MKKFTCLPHSPFYRKHMCRGYISIVANDIRGECSFTFAAAVWNCSSSLNSSNEMFMIIGFICQHRSDSSARTQIFVVSILSHCTNPDGKSKVFSFQSSLQKKTHMRCILRNNFSISLKLCIWLESAVLAVCYFVKWK